MLSCLHWLRLQAAAWLLELLQLLDLRGWPRLLGLLGLVGWLGGRTVGLLTAASCALKFSSLLAVAGCCRLLHADGLLNGVGPAGTH